MAITRRMELIANDYEAGVDISIIARKFGISEGSVIKKVKKYKQYTRPGYTPKSPKSVFKWNDTLIKTGIDKFIIENSRPPTAVDFDETSYLPSARQVQRRYGGLSKLREKFGYEKLDFTKGLLRSEISIAGNKVGIEAEDYFEPILVKKFGEPFVHVQKRYLLGKKNKYDFVVYAKNKVFGVDIFTTQSPKYISSNVRHKIIRYKNAPSNMEIIFVVHGNYDDQQIEGARSSISELKKYTNMLLYNESQFIDYINKVEELKIPNHFKGIVS